MPTFRLPVVMFANCARAKLIARTTMSESELALTEISRGRARSSSARTVLSILWTS